MLGPAIGPELGLLGMSSIVDNPCIADGSAVLTLGYTAPDPAEPDRANRREHTPNGPPPAYLNRPRPTQPARYRATPQAHAERATTCLLEPATTHSTPTTVP